METLSSNSTFFLPPDPSLTSPPSSVDFSPLKFIIVFLAVVAVPALAFTCFFSFKCSPSNPFNRFRRQGNPDDIERRRSMREKESAAVTSSEVKYAKEASVEEIGGECPVCLGAFKEEEVKVLAECRHSFHSVCVDLWLRTHPSCPICRVHVAVGSHGDKARSSSSDRSSHNRSGGAAAAVTPRGPPDASDAV